MTGVAIPAHWVKACVWQPENESGYQQVFQKSPLQVQLRKKLYGHEDLEGNREAALGKYPCLLRDFQHWEGLSKVILPSHSQSLEILKEKLFAI